MPIIGIVFLAALVVTTPKLIVHYQIQQANEQQAIHQLIHPSVVIDPQIASLSVDQRLDRDLSLPDVHGVLRGTTGVPIVRSVQQGHTSTTVLVTDYPFVVKKLFAHATLPYAIGDSIFLRVPGGSLGGRVTEMEGAPKVAALQDLFVFVRDQGEVAGGNNETTVVLSGVGGVFTVVGDLVRGQGQLAGFSESVPMFEQHFAH